MKIRFYCTCGASYVGTITPEHKARKILSMFQEQHAKPGCSPCDAKTAAKVRRKREATTWEARGRALALVLRRSVASERP